VSKTRIQAQYNLCAFTADFSDLYSDRTVLDIGSGISFCLHFVGDHYLIGYVVAIIGRTVNLWPHNQVSTRSVIRHGLI
jgi:hypothetical protein